MMTRDASVRRGAGSDGGDVAPGLAPEPPPTRVALWVPLAYAAVSAAWIALSGAFAAAMAPSVEALERWSIAKDLGFVAATALALHGILRWAMARQRRASEALRRATHERGRYELLAEHGREVILFVRPSDGRIVDANAAAVEAYGYTRDELRRRTVFDLRASGSSAAVAAQLAEADARGMRFETVHRRKDGSTFPVEVSSDGAAIDGARVLIDVIRDVTERSRVQEALRESEERLALAVEATGMGIWHAVPFGPMEWTERCREIFGVPDEVIADFEAFLRLIHPDDRAAVRAAVGPWLDPAGDGRYHQQYRCVRPDGSVRWVTSHGRARFAEVNGVRTPVLLVGTIVDITERMAVQTRLMQSDRLASVGMLAAGVAHEINNPLAYLTAALDFLDQRAGPLADAWGGEGADVARAVSEAREGAARIRHVVRDLATFSGVREDRREPVDVARIADSAISMAANEIRYRARVVKEYRGAPPVLANEGRLGQVLLNLVINAAQAIPEGRAEQNEIRVVVAVDGRGRVVVEVHDTGAGIPAEIVDRIFDPFFTTKPAGVGTGLGLSICRSIVVALGGEIAAERRASGGTTLRVALPAAPPGALEKPPPPPPPPPSAAEGGRRGKVLVVDDEPAVASAIRRVLASEHDVTTFTRAEDALAAIEHGERFDAIVCDLMMPHMTGMELHASLERLAPDHARRMILLTGGAFTPSAREFLDRVALPRCEKPFETSRLRAIVRAAVAAGEQR